MNKYPMFEKKIQDRVVTPHAQRQARPGYGIVLSYNEMTNTASILMSYPGSNEPGETYSQVTCPVQSGVQTVSPTTGRMCWVDFKDGVEGAPMITHFFSPKFETYDYQKHYSAKNPIPRFLMNM